MAGLLGVSVRIAHGYANGGRIPEPVARFLALTLSKYQRGRSPAAAVVQLISGRRSPGSLLLRNSCVYAARLAVRERVIAGAAFDLFD